MDEPQHDEHEHDDHKVAAPAAEPDLKKMLLQVIAAVSASGLPDGLKDIANRGLQAVVDNLPAVLPHFAS